MTGAIAVRIFGHAEEREKGPCGGRERERDRDGLGNGGITRALNSCFLKESKLQRRRKRATGGVGWRGKLAPFFLCRYPIPSFVSFISHPHRLSSPSSFNLLHMLLPFHDWNSVTLSQLLHLSKLNAFFFRVCFLLLYSFILLSCWCFDAVWASVLSLYLTSRISHASYFFFFLLISGCLWMPMLLSFLIEFLNQISCCFFLLRRWYAFFLSSFVYVLVVLHILLVPFFPLEHIRKQQIWTWGCFCNSYYCSRLMVFYFLVYGWYS